MDGVWANEMVSLHVAVVELAFSSYARQSRFKGLETKLRRVFVWSEVLRQLLIWVNVIAEVTQPVGKDFYIELKESYLMSRVDQLG